MNCEEIQNSLEPFLDNELPAEAAAEISGHLEACVSCQSKQKDLLGLQSIVRETISEIILPEKFQANLRARVEGSSNKGGQLQLSNRKRKYIIGMIAATAACFMGSVFLTQPHSSPLFASDIVQEENRHSSIPQEHMIAESPLKLTGWTLVDRRECQMGEKLAVRFNFAKENDAKQRLSLYQIGSGQFNAKGMSEHEIDGNKICCGELGKNSLLFCKSVGHDNVLVSNIPLNELMSLAIKNRISTS